MDRSVFQNRGQVVELECAPETGGVGQEAGNDDENDLNPRKAAGRRFYGQNAS